MSVRKRGSKYEVRWTEGGRKRSRSFDRKGDAVAFEADTKRRRALGGLASGVVESRQTVAEFMEAEWWPRYAVPNLVADTRRRYLEVWGTDLLPRVGSYPLREVSPLVVEDLRAALDRKGLSVASQRKALLLLSAILKRAVMRGLIPTNPVQAVPMPKQKPTAAPDPLTPETVEAIRRLLRPRDAMIVSLMAYAGLRPSEDRGLTWGDWTGRRTLRVFATKTGRERYVDLLEPLGQDLAEWRLRCGRPGDKTLIVPRSDGRDWGREDWGNWRERVWKPAAKAAGVTGDLRPYRLRSSFVSLLLWSGEDLVYVAEQAGHSVATLAKHYAGVIRELRGVEKRPAAEVIRDARDANRTQLRKVADADG